MTIAIDEVLSTISSCFIKNLGSDLIGVYLHGSLAMGCFNPTHSDVDLLVVTKGRMDHQTKCNIIEDLIEIERCHPNIRVEMSILLEEDLKEGKCPMYFLLHYSEMHKERYLKEQYLCEEAVDPDLTAHLAVMKARGICLHGRSIEGLGIAISDEDFLESILSDIDYGKNQISEKPHYTILNLCRTLKYLEDQSFSSKLEGGEWAIGKYGDEVDRVVQAMVYRYVGEECPTYIRDDEIEHVAFELLGKVQDIVEA